MQACGNSEICVANAQATSSACPAGATRCTRPIAKASSAWTARPVRIKSRARLSPISRGRRTAPPSIRGTPKRRQNTPSVASSAITRRSHHSASSSPPATAWPSMAAMTGLLSCMREGPMGASPAASSRLGAPAAMALRSAPAQNVPPSPVRIATSQRASASNARMASASCRAVARSTALRAWGRCSVTRHTAPRRSTVTLTDETAAGCAWDRPRSARTGTA